MLDRDTYWHDLTLQPGARLNITKGWRLFVSGTLTLGDGSRIVRDGNNGNQGFGGLPLVAGSLGGAGAGGGNACGPAAGATANSLGGSGGSTCRCAGAAEPLRDPAKPVGGARAFDGAVAALSGRTLDGVPVTGGAGGRGGNLTGGGGGGGVVIVAARVVQVTGNASITANGGNSAGGDSAGGGGGVVGGHLDLGTAGRRDAVGERRHWAPSRGSSAIRGGSTDARRQHLGEQRAGPLDVRAVGVLLRVHAAEAEPGERGGGAQGPSSAVTSSHSSPPGIR